MKIQKAQQENYLLKVPPRGVGEKPGVNHPYNKATNYINIKKEKKRYLM